MQDDIKWAEMARQLSHPKGEEGIATGKQMQQNNASMIAKTINLLNLQNGEQVLEIGFGNGAHIHLVLKKANHVYYTGIDISSTMLEEATKINAASIVQGKTVFKLSNGSVIPFADNSFDKIFTVNTVYFWEDPAQYAAEIFRVLKPGGEFCVCFAPKHFMQHLPFIQYGFKLYDIKTLEDLLANSHFIPGNTVTDEDVVKSDSGEIFHRPFAMICGSK